MPFALLLSTVVCCRIRKQRNSPVIPFDDATYLPTADHLTSQYYVSTTVEGHDPSASNNIQNSVQANRTRSIIQVYLSHPTLTEDSKLKLQRMMAKFHQEGIACKAAFTNERHTAEQFYRAIEAMMNKANFILICCDEERLQEMEKLSEGLSPVPTNSSRLFKREVDLIDAEHAKTEFAKIIVILMEGASPNCIQGIFTITRQYKYPDEFDDILARLQGVENYQLPPLARHSSSHS